MDNTLNPAVSSWLGHSMQLSLSLLAARLLWTGHSPGSALCNWLYHVIELYRRSIYDPTYAVSSLM